MSKQERKSLIVVVNDEGQAVTYVVRETDSEISIEASIDSRTSAASALRELVSLVCAILPIGTEKFYAFKLLRMVEENVDDLRDRMEAAESHGLDELPF